MNLSPAQRSMTTYLLLGGTAGFTNIMPANKIN